MAFCEVSQEQTPGSAAYAGDFGFKVLTSSDPAEKTKKLNAEIANGRLAMMAIIGMFFQAGIRFCAHIVCYNSTRKETPQRVWLKECNNVEHQHNRINIVEERSTNLCQFAWCVLSFWSLFLASHVFSTPHFSLAGIVLTAIFTHMLANKLSCRMCQEWIVSWCDMDRLYNWYNALEACTKTWHFKIWYSSFCLYIIIHIISLHSISYYHIMSYCIILYHIMSYHDICRIINNFDIATLCFWSLHAITSMSQDGLTGSAWGDWANYTASPLRAFENELGVQAPVGFWDPAGFTADGSVEDFKRRRATEIKHGRISMLATMGYITPVTWICWSCV